MDLRPNLVALLALEIDATDLGTQCTGKRPHFDRLVRHAVLSAFPF